MFEEPKYRADIFKIAGIAFVSPFCKIMLNPIGLYRSVDIIEFVYLFFYINSCWLYWLSDD